MLTSVRSQEKTANLIPAITLGPGFRLRPDHPEEFIGTCPRCRILLSFEISLAPNLATAGLDDPEYLHQLFHSRRGRPRKQAGQSAHASQIQQAIISDPAELAKRLIVHDRKVQVRVDGDSIWLVHASCGTPLQLFR